MIDAAEHYRALVQSSDDAIIAKDLDGKVLSWNPAAERLFGYKASEIVGQSVRCLLPPDCQVEEDRILAGLRAGEHIGQFITRRLHRDGHLLDLAVTVSPVLDASGQVAGASSISRDIGKWRQAEQQLRDSEERFHLLADNIAPLAWMGHPDGHLFWYNQRWYQYTGTCPEEMEGWGWQSVHHPDHLERVMQVWQQALASGNAWEDTFPLRRHDGAWRWFLSRAQPIRDSSGAIVRWFGTNTDVTEQREQADRIRLLLMEVNHRSKNLLAMVMALARRTARAGGPDFVERFADRIHSLALNQDILVRREWREVPMAELVQSQLAFLAGSPGELSLSGPPLALAPKAAETIGMALHELATNALKHGALSVPGGRVEIGWRVAEGEAEAQSALTVWWQESGGPPVIPPTTSGFGTTLIRDVPAHALGEVTLEFAPAGVRWELRCGPGALADISNWARKIL